MNSFFAQNRLCDYIDGTLSPEDNAIVEKALAEDPELRQEYEELYETVNMLQEFGKEALSDYGLGESLSPSRDLSASIMEQIEQEPAPNVVRLPFKRNLSFFIAAAASILMVVSVLPENTQSHTKGASLVREVPKTNRIQIPTDLNNQLAKLPTPVEAIKVADPPPPKPKSRSLSSKPKRTRSISSGSVPVLAADLPTSYKDNPYILFINDPDILYKIEDIANENNAQLAQRDGSNFKPYAMSDGKPTQVLRLSTTDTKIDAIEEQLSQLGTEFHKISSQKSGSPIEILININFE